MSEDLERNIMGSWARDFPFHPFDTVAPDHLRMPKWAEQYVAPDSTICYQLDERANFQIVGWRFHTQAELDACLADHPELPLLTFWMK
ncbi:hypothetical protein K2X14_11610 [Acetobacter sp. TBRC 12305]|uniref:Uncharacterized protein n=1 Tax=Acetobacter garciniae TaxID=2817435 RepID=A0A939KMH8_9PROT|nr:hypothetical protein [Acetobacter garciniae]MBO1325343.1 hypothetical protein [Acetobacter garciniae]MBX0345485.1 hypothetical protein [Acetobacter garciniae]